MFVKYGKNSPVCVNAGKDFRMKMKGVDKEEYIITSGRENCPDCCPVGWPG